MIAIGAGGYWYMTRPTSPIPASIEKQLTFSPFILPSDVKNYTTSDYKFSTAEGQVPILSFIIHVDQTKLTVSEYTQPSEFAEIPEYKEHFLSNVINQYATVQTSNGTIYLGHMEHQANKQLGIMIERGLLVLMSPNEDLTSEQWRGLGDQLEIQKIDN